MGASIPQNIRDVFQRVRIKKIEAFISIPDYAGSGSDTRLIQIAVCRSLQDDATINPLNVPGAQIKLHKSTSADAGGDPDGTADYLRVARFYPPVLVDNNEVPLTKENWGDTSNASAQWKCFNWQLTGSVTGITSVNYYATITLLCDGLKA